MAIIRVNKTSDYTVISNHHFRNKNMSLKAKGILSLMLSLPDDWDYSINGLIELSSDGKDSVVSALKELEQLGYLVRTKSVNDKGQFAGYNYDIYEIPPRTENPFAEKPHTEKPPQLNTKELNTNINNKLINNTTEKNEFQDEVDEILDLSKERKNRESQFKVYDSFEDQPEWMKKIFYDFYDRMK